MKLIQSCLTKYVWDPAARPLCWGCGQFILTLTNRQVRGLEVMCAKCMEDQFNRRIPHPQQDKGADA